MKENLNRLLKRVEGMHKAEIADGDGTVAVVIGTRMPDGFSLGDYKLVERRKQGSTKLTLIEEATLIAVAIEKGKIVGASILGNEFPESERGEIAERLFEGFFACKRHILQSGDKGQINLGKCLGNSGISTRGIYIDSDPGTGERQKPKEGARINLTPVSGTIYMGE